MQLQTNTSIQPTYSNIRTNIASTMSREDDQRNRESESQSKAKKY